MCEMIQKAAPRGRAAPRGALYQGDNLTVLREHIQDESVDLIYLDPPFNSRQSYTMLPRARPATFARARVHAFEDAWVWDSSKERALAEITAREGASFEALAILMEAL